MTPQDSAYNNNNNRNNILHDHHRPSVSAFAAVSHYPYAYIDLNEEQGTGGYGGPGYGYGYEYGPQEVVNAMFDPRYSFDPGVSMDDHPYQPEIETRLYRQPQPRGQRPLRGRGRRRWDAGADSVTGSSGLVPDDDPDDTRKFYPDVEMQYGVGLFEGYVDYGDFLIDDDEEEEELGYGYGSGVPVTGQTGGSGREGSDTSGSDIGNGFSGEHAQFNVAVDPDFPITTFERNFTIDQFAEQWTYQSNLQIQQRSLSIAPYTATTFLNYPRPEKVFRPPDYDPVDFFDLQRIPWWEMGANREDARVQRDLWYRPYHNVDHPPQKAKKINRTEFYFRESAMYNKYRASIEHFQLRNLMSVPGYNTVHFANEGKLLSWVPAYDDLTCLIDLSRPPRDTILESPVKISTMKTAHGVSIVGGFGGEYALRAEGTTKPTSSSNASAQGYVTRDLNGITNHIDIIASRTSRSPMGIFASNDNHLRILDCETDTFTANYDLARAVNCTATSPDNRLRAVVGDSPEALIIEADTGRPVRPLRAHRDFGFAAAWSPDMLHIATGNQDSTTIIWDARMWKPLTMLAAQIAGPRSLQFSPVGGGPRSLLTVEPADRITVIDAQTYNTHQVLDFFGEIGGAGFSPDGSAIWVANSDDSFGGFMEFQRCGWGAKFGPGGLPNEWAFEEDLSDDERCVVGGGRERGLRYLRNWSDEEYESMLL